MEHDLVKKWSMVLLKDSTEQGLQRGSATRWSGGSGEVMGEGGWGCLMRGHVVKGTRRSWLMHLGGVPEAGMEMCCK